MYLPSAQVEKAVHQLQDSKAICQTESAAYPRLPSVGAGGRGTKRGEIDPTHYMDSNQVYSAVVKVFQHIYWVLTCEAFLCVVCSRGTS